MPDLDMPTFSLELPHRLYWVGLIAFPLIAMALARRPRREGPAGYSLVLGYMILVTGGIIGLHRPYLRSLLGLLFIPAFVFVLYANAQEREARGVLSDASNQVRIVERVIAREGPRIEEARADLPGLREALEEAEPGSFAERSAQRRVESAEEALGEGQARLDEAQAQFEEVEAARAEARDARAFWSRAGATVFWAILAALAVDALLMPWLVRRANRTAPPEEPDAPHLDYDPTQGPDDRERAENWIDRLSLFAGEFVAYWAVIAVFVYYYEVIARYVFNAPTSWAHEAMYLMFGMQYLIAGSYAMLTESHVRVDILYAPLPRRKKAWTDLATSVFFFIFAGTLLVTGWIFAMDSLAVPTGNAVVSDWARGEIGLAEMLASFDARQWTDPNIRWGELSFNEWEIPLWPMKWVMVMGGVLLVLQGVSKIGKDIRTLREGVPQGEPA